jgi:hypothetical protein
MLRNDGFDRAQARYENKLPNEPKSLCGFCIKDRVRIKSGILKDWPELDGASNIGEVRGFDCGHIIVKCGWKEYVYYLDDLEHI